MTAPPPFSLSVCLSVCLSASVHTRRESCEDVSQQWLDVCVNVNERQAGTDIYIYTYIYRTGAGRVPAPTCHRRSPHHQVYSLPRQQPLRCQGAKLHARPFAKSGLRLAGSGSERRVVGWVGWGLGWLCRRVCNSCCLLFSEIGDGCWWLFVINLFIACGVSRP